MITSIKNKKMNKILVDTGISMEDVREIRDNWSMFINHIENTLSDEDREIIIVEALAENFLRNWNR